MTTQTIAEFVYNWSRLNKFGTPQYSCTSVGNGNGHRAKVQIGTLQNGFWAEGRGETPVESRIMAAEQLCWVLYEEGLINKPEDKRFLIEWHKRKVATTAEEERPTMDNCDVAKKLCLSSFDHDLRQYHENRKGNSKHKEEKLKTAEEISNCIRIQFGDATMSFVVGSTGADIAANDSGLNLTFLNLDDNCRDSCDQKESMGVLKKLQTVLQSNFNGRYDSVQLRNEKRLPVLRINGLKSGAFKFRVHLTFNDATSVRTSHLMYHYNEIDSRFGALTIILKDWAVKNAVPLTGFAITLLVVHFLQFGTSPKVLPNLIQIAPQYFDLKKRPLVEQLSHSDPVKTLLQKGVVNESSTSELLLGFFAYYANEVNFAKEMITVRSPSRFHKYSGLRKIPPSIYIEEPFDRSFVDVPANADKLVKLNFAKALAKLRDSTELIKSLGL